MMAFKSGVRCVSYNLNLVFVQMKSFLAAVLAATVVANDPCTTTCTLPKVLDPVACACVETSEDSAMTSFAAATLAATAAVYAF